MSRPADASHRIVVLRAGGIGDLVFALPALEALRASFPRASITLLGEEFYRPLVEGRPAVAGGPALVDEVIGLARGSLGLLGSGEDDDEGSGAAQLARLAADPFDIAVQLHGGGRYSNPFIVAMGSRRTVGLRAPGTRPLDQIVPYVYYQSEVMRDLEVVELVGAAPVAFVPRLHVTSSEHAAGRHALPLDVRDRAFAVLHPGAGDPRRRWPIDGFAAVARALREAGIVPVVTCAPRERGLALGLVEAAAPARVVDLSGALDLVELAGLLAEASLMVGNDSGPLHLAAAVGAPTVGVFWCGNLINAGPPFRARHRPAIAWRLDCPVCGTDCTSGTCVHQESFVADVPAAEVVDAALELAAAGR